MTGTLSIFVIWRLVNCKREQSIPRGCQRLDHAVHPINQYPVDSVVCFVNTSTGYSDLSSG